MQKFTWRLSCTGSMFRRNGADRKNSRQNEASSNHWKGFSSFCLYSLLLLLMFLFDVISVSFEQRIRPGDWVLVSLRDFQDKKCDIILKYAEDEVRSLRQLNEIVGNNFFVQGSFVLG